MAAHKNRDSKHSKPICIVHDAPEATFGLERSIIHKMSV
jgi:hypothetical protein